MSSSKPLNRLLVYGPFISKCKNTWKFLHERKGANEVEREMREITTSFGQSEDPSTRVAVADRTISLQELLALPMQHPLR